MQLLNDNPALRAHLESQADFTNQFTQKMYDTLRQLTELNLKLSRQIIEGSIHTSREMMSATDPAQQSQLAMKQLQASGERLRAYQQQLLALLAGAQAEFTHAAERLPDASRSAGAVADEMMRNARAAGDGGASKPH